MLVKSKIGLIIIVLFFLSFLSGLLSGWKVMVAEVDALSKEANIYRDNYRLEVTFARLLSEDTLKLQQEFTWHVVCDKVILLWAFAFSDCHEYKVMSMHMKI